MSDWNYRIIKHEENGSIYYAVHEVFYDEDGTIVNWTAQPVSIVGDTEKEVIEDLKFMLSDSKSPVLNERDLANKARLES